MGLVPLQAETTFSASSLAHPQAVLSTHEIQCEGGRLQPKGTALTRHQTRWHPVLGFPVSSTVRNKSLLFKPPSL